jgi:hypothetical protein
MGTAYKVFALAHESLGPAVAGFGDAPLLQDQGPAPAPAQAPAQEPPRDETTQARASKMQRAKNMAQKRRQARADALDRRTRQ